MFFSPQISRRRLHPVCAFTLLELLAVLAIVAVLASIVLGVGRRASESGRAARTRAELAVLAAALESYRQQHGDYPRTTDGAVLLQALIGRLAPDGAALVPAQRALIESARFHIARPGTPDVARDPFIDASAVLHDAWGEPYRYAHRTVAPWANPSCVLYSAGPDRSDAPALLPGGYADTTQPANADNLYANRP